MSTLVLRNPAGERLDFTLAETGSLDLVVIGHGVTAHKDREWALRLARELDHAGLAALRFSFAGNGGSEGRFQDATVSKEVQDLGAVLDAFERRRITYVGHSQGAAVGVLRAASDERIRRLVSLGGMVDLKGFAQRKFGDLTPGRDVMWDKPECPLSQSYLDDMEALGTVAPRAARIRVPWLLVHGTADTVVPPEESRDLAERTPGAELLELPDADHVFSGEDGPIMAKLVVGWLRTTKA